MPSTRVRTGFLWSSVEGAPYPSTSRPAVKAGLSNHRLGLVSFYWECPISMVTAAKHKKSTVSYQRRRLLPHYHSNNAKVHVCNRLFIVNQEGHLFKSLYDIPGTCTHVYFLLLFCFRYFKKQLEFFSIGAVLKTRQITWIYAVCQMPNLQGLCIVPPAHGKRAGRFPATRGFPPTILQKAAQ